VGSSIRDGGASPRRGSPDEGNADAREGRIRSWREPEIPNDPAFPGDPREWEKTRYGRAELTELGERLLGLRPWKA